ncbi:hypothetical protein TrCOL_g6736 [Triparma columacea]|uniref:Endonuclease/exonuclease/phosphatase domain-containing protein n=1 Tax=Triparma columacea TaxID=722753 RepID=A0A9W7L763_9STRA|nr:hypothetical protein TrCOL_g6736 [Triparma columacea]
MAERLRELSSRIADRDLDVLAFQEMYLPYSRSIFSKSLCGEGGEYEMIGAHKFFPSFPALSCVPCLLSFAIARYVLQSSAVSSFGFSFLVSPAAFLFLFKLLSLCLPLFFPIPTDGIGIFERLRLDFMGTAICFKRSVWSDVKKISANPFSDSIRGYPKPSLSVKNLGVWLLLFVQHTFFRPGFLMAVGTHKESLKKVLIVNAHLVLGYPNPFRARQVKRVLEEVTAYSVSEGADCVILCGDFNAPPQDACFNAIRTAGYLDSRMWVPRGQNVCTQCCKNPLVTDDGEEFGSEDNRIDYVFVRSLGKRNRLMTELMSARTVFDFADEDGIMSDHFGIELDVAIS